MLPDGIRRKLEEMANRWIRWRSLLGLAALALGPACYGFGYATVGGNAQRVITVTSLADSGAGSLRTALATVTSYSDGATIRFGVAGGIELQSGLVVNSNTTIDGNSAPAPGITLWGEGTGELGRGVLNIFGSEVVVRNIRIRNAVRDGIHVAPKANADISRIWIERVSITRSGDGGIDITGYNGFTVSDVTILANYLAGNGIACSNQACTARDGGASLVKYGASRVSFLANYFDKNLRRNPTLSADGSSIGAVGDIRFNLIFRPEQSGIQIVDNAQANIVQNHFSGTNASVTRSNGGAIYASGNTRESTSTPDPNAAGSTNTPFPKAGGLPDPPPAPDQVVVNSGATPRDALDAHYISLADYTSVRTDTWCTQGGSYCPLGSR